jgi:amino acid adenylation domain-containing protein
MTTIDHHRTPTDNAELSPAKRRLVELLEQDRRQRAQPIARRPQGEDAVLSFGQRRLWFLDRWSPGSTTYNEFVRLRLEGPLDVEALRASVATVVERHAALRTVFREAPTGAVQVVVPDLVPALEHDDLTALSPAERAAALEARQQHELEAPFDLAAGPLVRARLVRLSGELHELLFSVHHIACDGWSLGIFVRELATCYTAFERGEAPVLPALPIQYADYARWQIEAAESPNAAAQLAYWKRQLPEPAPVLDLPFARPRPAVRGSAGLTEFFTIGPELAAKVGSLARDLDATPFMVLMAVFQALLHRYTGDLDVRVGTPVAGRTRVEAEALIGFFVNMLVLRGDFTGEPTFRELVRRTRATSLAAYAHQEVSFERLVDALGARRTLAHTPLFQAGFVLQNAPVAPLALPRLRVSPVEVDRGTSKFDLLLSLTEAAGGFRGALECSADLFDAATAARMVGHFTELLASAMVQPDERVARLPLLTAEERRAATRMETRTFASDELLHVAFARQAAARPDQIAVSCGDHALTYAELDRRTNRLAHALRARGVGPDVPVGLYLERSVELVVGVLGILKAGGAYVPIDPVYPADRRAFMLEDAGVRIVLTQAALAPAIAGTGAEAIALDAPDAPDGFAGASGGDGPVEVPGAHADQLAYVIYTSGSTGKPKGALLTHRNVTRLFAATAASYRFTERDVWPLFHSIAFDVSVWELWGALLHGGRLVVVPFATSRSPRAFYDLLLDEGVTVLNQTPSAFRQVIREDEQRTGGRVQALRYVILAGEALELGMLAPWYQHHPDTAPRVVNMYGITETTVHVTYRPIRRADLTSGRGSVIGMPMPDLECLVLDAHRQPVPIGVAGELYVGGPGLARGYLNRPELTAERFIAHPFRAEPGARLYKSGDLVRRLDDADFAYLGRIDLQVKIRGFRVELEEIEAVLNQHPAIRASVVLAREDLPGDRRLVAYVVLVAGASVGLAELREHVGKQLPDYMVPAAVVVLDAFPLTVNGKLDRRALPAPSSTSVLAPAQRVALAGELEHTLAAHWKQVLGLDVVGATDNFFDVGGHSLHMATLQARLRDQLGREIPMVALFQYPTIRALAAYLAGAEATPATPTGQAPARAVRRGAQSNRRELRRSQRGGQGDGPGDE